MTGPSLTALPDPFPGESFSDYNLRMTPIYGYGSAATVAIGDRWIAANTCAEDLPAPLPGEPFSYYVYRVQRAHGAPESGGGDLLLATAAERYRDSAGRPYRELLERVMKR